VILLDTQSLVWLDQGSSRIGPHSRALVDAALQNDMLAVSAISFWEIALLHQAGQLTLPLNPVFWHSSLLANGLREIPLTGELGMLAVSLDNIHRDPADRFIIATALHHNATLITSERKILDWPGQLNRQDLRL
jgi:PIN domain nuclease of toxin-antitoxin system